MSILILFVLAFTIPVYPGESIQDAMNSSNAGDTVLVMPGIHYGNESKNNLLTITGEHNGIVLLGNPSNPSSVILSGDSIFDSIIDLTCTATETIDTTMVISGFTFLGGYASLDAFGGAIHSKHSSPLITHSVFQGCSADNGAAIYSWKGAPVIRFCSFLNNECLSAGGAVYLYSSNAFISHSSFSGNVSWDDGGAIFCYHSNPEIFNCLFIEGYAHDDGGGIYCYAFSDPEISFCTFHDNFSLNTGSAVYFRVNSSPNLNHNIVTGNIGPAFYIQDGGDPVFLYNCVWGNPDGNYGNLPDPTGTDGNISANPLFVDNYLLSQILAGQNEESPCVNSGEGIVEDYGLEFTWTRTDSVPDSFLVDMGYHNWSKTQWQSNPEEPECNTFLIYPNPTLGSVTVVFPDNGSYYTLLEIYDLTGRRVYMENINNSNESIKIDISTLSSGIYFVKISGESNRITRRITILTN